MLVFTRDYRPMMMCRSFLIFVAFLSLKAWAIEPETALELLYGKGDSIHYDAAGYSYRVFNVSESKELQSLFDTITSRLLHTSIGTALCRDVLDGKAESLIDHLALSPQAAATAAEECRLSEAKSSWVYNSPNLTPSKLTLNGRQSPRRYVLIVTDRPDLPLDSWTDAFSNQTTLFLHSSRHSSDLSLQFLTQIIAHEMAIYFDSKSWPQGPDWNNIPALAESRIKMDSQRLTTSAALNPGLATVLAFIRAYKVERVMLKEISNLGLMGADPVIYNTKDLPFLKSPCRSECIAQFIQQQIQWIDLFQPALLALSPHYRAARLDLLRESSQPISEAEVNALERYPPYYFAKIRSEMAGLNLVSLAQSAEEKRMHKEINQTMGRMLQADLKTLKAAKIWVPREAQNFDLLAYLAVPLLSDANISLAAGPRPRIRTGGTK